MPGAGVASQPWAESFHAVSNASCTDPENQRITVSRHVIIHLPVVGSDLARWAMADESGELVSELFEGSLTDAADAVEGRRASLILPGDDVLLAEAVVPGGSQARALQAVPFALEEQLADDVDSLHFALGSKGGGDAFPVAVIGQASMQLVMEQCGEAGLRPAEIVPETLAVPCDGTSVDRASWTALLDDGQAVVRLDNHHGFATDAAMAHLMLDGARQNLDESMEAALRVFVTRPGVSLTAPEGVEVESIHCDSRLEVYARGLANSPYINLLQGSYSPKTQFDKTWKPWRWSAALLGILLVVLFGGKIIDASRLSSQEAAIDQGIEQVFTEAMPGTRLQRPEAQMKARLSALGAGNIDGFTSRLSQLAESLATQPQTRLISISYRDGRFDLDLTTDELPTLDALASELEQRGSLDMSVQSANRDGEGLRGRVRVE